MRLRTFLKPLSFLPAIALMYMIYAFSAQEANISSGTSYRVCSKIVRTVNDAADLNLEEYQIENYIQRIHGASRKIAHVTEFFLLAVAVSFPLYVYGCHGILLVLVSGTFCVLYACLDEYHQSFVAGRAASMRDVAIDSAGILIGIILVRIIGWTGRKTIFRPVPEKDSRQEMKMRRLEHRVEDMEQRQRSYAGRTRVDPRRAPEELPRTKRRAYPPEQVLPPYEEYEDDPDIGSSDELSEDMPFAGLFRKKGL